MQSGIQGHVAAKARRYCFTNSCGASRSEAGICRGSPHSGIARSAHQLCPPPRQTGGGTTTAGLAPRPTTTWGLQAAGGATDHMSLAHHARGPAPGCATCRAPRKSLGLQRSKLDTALRRLLADAAKRPVRRVEGLQEGMLVASSVGEELGPAPLSGRTSHLP